MIVQHARTARTQPRRRRQSSSSSRHENAIAPSGQLGLRSTGVLVLVLLSSLVLFQVQLVVVVKALSTTCTNSSSSTCTTSNSNIMSCLLTTSHIQTIAAGGVAVIPNFLSTDMIHKMRQDAKLLHQQGYFVADGLTNTALNKDVQGFTQTADRQTFRGGQGWFDVEAGDIQVRTDFDMHMNHLKHELAVGLHRPTLLTEAAEAKAAVAKHEMTYNWYEVGASLGRHLDEHHEETKGTKGWLLPTRRSVTWLVYLNEDWNHLNNNNNNNNTTIINEGGSLKTFPRSQEQMQQLLSSTSSEAKASSMPMVQVGSHDDNLQVGWMDGFAPVFLDASLDRPSGQTALYMVMVDNKNKNGLGRKYVSLQDFDVPRQPIEFETFLSNDYRNKGRFEQISTSRLDPRFAIASIVASGTTASTGSSVASTGGTTTGDSSTTATTSADPYFLEIEPTAGTLVLFDSVTLPHLVHAVTGQRPRIAATGWFHEDNPQSIY
jgi:Rps23 Pro-64 3,4-dihydroxylase Tpa1-like proline 4-hydroxylase